MRPYVGKLARGAAWVGIATASFMASQYIVGYGIRALIMLGASWEVGSPTSLLVYRLIIYIVTALLLAGVVWYKDRAVGLGTIALTRLPWWKDIGLVVPGALAYIVLTVAALNIAGTWFGVDTDQTQDLGFSTLGSGEMLVAFIVLVILTPFFEEALFRGFLYGRLRGQTTPWWLPALVVSALFGLAHMQWNVGLDVFCLSMVACGLRELTGSIWSGILLHMLKNMVAFLVMFVFVGGVGS